MLYIIFLLIIFLNNNNLKIIDKKIATTKFIINNYNLSKEEYEILVLDLDLLKMNRLRIIIQEKLD